MKPVKNGCAFVPLAAETMNLFLETGMPQAESSRDSKTHGQTHNG